GWFPRARNHEAVLTAFNDLKARASKAGRDIKTISVSVFGMPSADEAKLDAYRAAGFTRVLLRLPPEGREVVLPLIDQWAKVIHCSGRRSSRGGSRCQPAPAAAREAIALSKWPPGCPATRSRPRS